MNSFILLIVGFGALAFGSVLGYYARQSIAKRQIGTIEQKLQKRIADITRQAEEMTARARDKARGILESAKTEEDERRKAFLETEQLFLRRESALDRRISDSEQKEKDFQQKVAKLQEVEKTTEETHKEILQKLEQIAQLSSKQAREELLQTVERQYEKDIAARMKKLETEGQERFEQRAKEILTYAIQKTAVPQTQEITNTTLLLPSEDTKGKIIGKEGRNIRALERLGGVEIVVDESPEAVVISGFDPVRRHIAKVALERLIKDGRIHPAKVEEEMKRAETELENQIKQIGEATVFELGLVGLDLKLVYLLGRLKFRTSYGQNVLSHSIEVAYLASALASEIGADAAVCKKAGLFHDIGKTLDHQVEGSHVDIGMRILEKFGAEKAVITAMKSHHEQYPYESLEAIIVQAADAISASRPGARKDTLENYLKRVGDLEKLASSFPGIEKVYAIQAGREIRVFVKPEEIDDPSSQKLARDIANRIQEELRYPGEIKVTLIRENRFIEYAR